MKNLITFLFFMILISTSAFSQFKVGAGAGLIFDGSLFGVGGKGHYTINEDFAGQGSFTYYFEDFTVWTLDLDVHYSGFDIGDLESFRLTPFAGLNIFRASILGFGATDTGINLGLNGTMPLTDSMDLYVEPKFMIGGGSSLAISAGVYF